MAAPQTPPQKSLSKSFTKPVKTGKKAVAPNPTPPEAKPAAQNDSAPVVLTDKQRIWLDEYLKCWNATEAARIACYADPELSGWENRHNPIIETEISRRLSASAMSADEVLMRLSDFARGDLSPFIKQEGENIVVDLTSEEAKANLHLLKKVKTKRRRGGRGEDTWEEHETEFEIHDPQAALVHMGRHHKLFTDKTEVSGPDGKPIQTEDVGTYSGMGRGELNSRILEALTTPPAGK